jgi:hypothetical protein
MAYNKNSSIILASCDMAFCWILSMLRMYVRIGVQKAFWADDFFALLALVSCPFKFVMRLLLIRSYRPSSRS